MKLSTVEKYSKENSQGLVFNFIQVCFSMMMLVKRKNTEWKTFVRLKFEITELFRIFTIFFCFDQKKNKHLRWFELSCLHKMFSKHKKKSIPVMQDMEDIQVK